MSQRSYFEYKRNNSFLYHNISQLFKRVETGLFVFLCLALIITSKVNQNITNNISINIVNVAMPVAGFASAPFNLIVDFIVNFKELINAKSKNQALIKENERLKSLYIKSLSINQENRQLKDILQYASIISSNYLVARLISSPYQIYSNNVFVDAGENRGVNQDDIITGDNALIGRVARVGEDKSRIILATDINSRIPIITSKSRVKGVLAGNNSSVMDILYLEKDHHIAVGDLVFTSGDGDSIPPGILVGAVTKVEEKNVEVQMVENVRNLDIVGILRY
jgi:rod shape-determining protein MreC